MLIADKYNLDDLVTLCEASLVQTICLGNAIDIIDVAFKINGVDNLRSACIDYIATKLDSLFEDPKWATTVASNSKIMKAVLQKK